MYSANKIDCLHICMHNGNFELLEFPFSLIFRFCFLMFTYLVKENIYNVEIMMQLNVVAYR